MTNEKSRRGHVATIILVAALLHPTLGLASEIETAGRRDQATIGFGYDSKSQTFKSPCLVATSSDVEFAGGQSATVNFARVGQNVDLQSALGFSAGARARFGIVKVSAAAEFAKQASSSRFAETTTFVATINYKNALLKTRALTTLAKRALGNGRYASDAFTKVCGDEFVEQVALGARLYIVTKIEFSSISEKQRFSARFSVDAGLWGANGSLNQAQNEFKSSASVTIYAYQVGGRVERLPTIFSAASQQVVDRGPSDVTPGALSVVRCSISNFSECEKAISRALDYATNRSDPDAFPQQIAANYNPSKPSGLAEMAYITKDWTNAGILVRPRELSEIIKVKRAALGRELDAAIEARTRLDVLLGRPRFRLSKAQDEKFSAFSKTIDSRLATIFEAAQRCYEKEDDCPSAVDALLGEVDRTNRAVGFSLEALGVTPETFAQWCDAAGIENDAIYIPILASTRKTVDAVVEYARGIMYRGDDDTSWAALKDKCGAVEEIIGKTDLLSLSGKDVSDLRPLVSFAHLSVLEISRASLKDVAPLSRLKNLKSLDLSCNSISDVSPIYAISGLRAVAIRDNFVRTVAGFGGMSNLTYLDASGNPLETNTLCPLTLEGAVCFLGDATNTGCR